MRTQDRNIKEGTEADHEGLLFNGMFSMACLAL